MQDINAVNFIIFSLARSGTSFLTTSLRSHPEVLCHGEALLPRHFERHVYGTAQTEISAEMCEADPVTFANKLFQYRDGHAAVGFKLFPGHSRPAHKSLLKDKTIHKVVLKRENHLASFSSRVIAKQTGQWSLRNASMQKQVKAEFVLEDFEKHIRNATNFYAKVDEFCQGPRLDITYETHIMGQTLEPVLEFLNVDAKVSTHTKKAKQLGRSIAERFENPETVLEHLEKIGHLDWAYE